MFKHTIISFPIIAILRNKKRFKEGYCLCPTPWLPKDPAFCLFEIWIPQSPSWHTTVFTIIYNKPFQVISENKSDADVDINWNLI